jgi:hypothetical protein
MRDLIALTIVAILLMCAVVAFGMRHIEREIPGGKCTQRQVIRAAERENACLKHCLTDPSDNCEEVCQGEGFEDCHD